MKSREGNVTKLRTFLTGTSAQGLRQAQTDRALVILSLSKYERWLLNLMTLPERDDMFVKTFVSHIGIAS